MSYENHKYKLLVTSVLFLLLGIAFMVYPANSMIMLVRITGAFLILLGIMIFIPTMRERAMLGFRFGLLVALTIIIAVFGVILLVMPGAFVQVFWITLGIILILDGIKNLLYLTAMPFRFVNIALSVISILCGVLILTHPFGTGLASMVLVGAFFAYSGVAGVVLSIISKIKGRSKTISAADGSVADAGAAGEGGDGDVAADEAGSGQTGDEGTDGEETDGEETAGEGIDDEGTDGKETAGEGTHVGEGDKAVNRGTGAGIPEAGDETDPYEREDFIRKKK